MTAAVVLGSGGILVEAAVDMAQRSRSIEGSWSLLLEFSAKRRDVDDVSRSAIGASIGRSASGSIGSAALFDASSGAEHPSRMSGHRAVCSGRVPNQPWMGG